MSNVLDFEKLIERRAENQNLESKDKKIEIVYFEQLLAQERSLKGFRRKTSWNSALRLISNTRFPLLMLVC